MKVVVMGERARGLEPRPQAHRPRMRGAGGPLPSVLFQPIASDDVAAAVGRVSVGTPLNGLVELGGPEQFRFEGLVRQILSTRDDRRRVVSDPHAWYFGTELSECSLVPARRPDRRRHSRRGLSMEPMTAA